MFGYMNVFLAEVDVFYFKLFDLEEVNDVLKIIDMVVIVGVNDVVNFVVEDDFGSLIYGMFVFKVWEVKNVIVLKCSMCLGYVGIENLLFFYEKICMLFGDVKDILSNLVFEIKSL